MRIGIWGTSQAGGHVLIAVCVSQVPSCGFRGAGNVSSLASLSRSMATQASRHGIIPNGAKEFHLHCMDGSPILRTIETHDPLLFCPNIRIPTMVIDVENEDLWDVKNGRAAFDFIHDWRKEYVVLPNANHYDAYGKCAEAARKAAVEYFTRHLVREVSGLALVVILSKIPSFSVDGVVGEPCFVPRLGRQSAEDDGFLIVQEYSLVTQLPSFVVLDAVSLAVLARVRLSNCFCCLHRKYKELKQFYTSTCNCTTHLLPIGF
jgi:hypothetical protein